MITQDSGACPTIYIATSAADGYKPACTFAWRIEDGVSQMLASSAKMPVQRIPGSDATKALHPAITEALRWTNCRFWEPLRCTEETNR